LKEAALVHHARSSSTSSTGSNGSGAPTPTNAQRGDFLDRIRSKMVESQQSSSTGVGASNSRSNDTNSPTSVGAQLARQYAKDMMPRPFAARSGASEPVVARHPPPSAVDRDLEDQYINAAAAVLADGSSGGARRRDPSRGRDHHDTNDNDYDARLARLSAGGGGSDGGGRRPSRLQIDDTLDYDPEPRESSIPSRVAPPPEPITPGGRRGSVQKNMTEMSAEEKKRIYGEELRRQMAEREAAKKKERHQSLIDEERARQEASRPARPPSPSPRAALVNEPVELFDSKGNPIRRRNVAAAANDRTSLTGAASWSPMASPDNGRGRRRYSFEPNNGARVAGPMTSAGNDDGPISSPVAANRYPPSAPVSSMDYGASPPGGPRLKGYAAEAAELARLRRIAAMDAESKKERAEREAARHPPSRPSSSNGGGIPSVGRPSVSIHDPRDDGNTPPRSQSPAASRRTLSIDDDFNHRVELYPAHKYEATSALRDDDRLDDHDDSLPSRGRARDTVDVPAAAVRARSSRPADDRGLPSFAFCTDGLLMSFTADLFVVYCYNSYRSSSRW
jgi:hypothetical protein